MCIVCVLWEKGKLTKQEVDNALSELVIESFDDEELMHYQEVIEKVQRE